MKRSPLLNTDNDKLQNNLLVIEHHIGDIRDYMKKKLYDRVEEALKDIDEAIDNLKTLLPKQLQQGIKRDS